MRISSLLIAGALLAGGVAWQVNLPAPLASHFDRLATAESLSVDYTGRYLGEAAATMHLSMAKPNLFRLTTADGFVVSDGKTITTYVAKDKTYSDVPVTEDSLAQFAARPEVRIWGGFLVKKAKEEILTARATGKRTVANAEVSEITVGMKNDTTGTLYIDGKAGVARGASLKSGAKEYLVLASKIELDKAAPEGEFAFVAPEGAKKAEAKIEPTYANVQAILTASCMPCHNAQNHRANLDLTNYQGVVAGVTPGNHGASPLATALRAAGPARMPKNAPPLPEAKIALIEAWIDAGAKQ